MELTAEQQSGDGERGADGELRGEVDEHRRRVVLVEQRASGGPSIVGGSAGDAGGDAGHARG